MNARIGLAMALLPAAAVCMFGCADKSVGEALLTAGRVTVVKGAFKDSRDSTTYKTVTIDGKKWMAENLNYYNETGSWCYDDKPDNCVKYGRLYNWNTAMDGTSSSARNPSGVRGVCPSGWHLPSYGEWNDLFKAAGLSEGSKLKSKTGWKSGGDGKDEYGFSALPGGMRGSSGTFKEAGESGYWWSATETKDIIMLYNYNTARTSYAVDKTNGYSVRCRED
ncbi:MAG: fibrobacter succinogenes major paralogous domain-containing protein [Chitinispirillales bacterium]|jgi:uncharacterized protein (TIGR02145 family)|nr:fibrobacter succinogenes major paralogous domain-containing protein [Chitinispirillales bacterium]